MKKNKQYRAKKQVIRNSKRSANNKKRNYPRVIINGKHIKMHCPVETTRAFEIGPSLVTETKDGKTVNWNSWSSKNKQQPTKIAKTAMEENKAIKSSKKELIKNILMKAGYDPTVRYTRKEKKRFTRIVKNNLFTKPKPVTLTTEQIKEKIKTEKLAKKVMQAKFDEEVRNNPLPPKKGKQMAPSAAELSVKEKPNKRTFEYTVNRKMSENPMRNYDFKKGTFEANTKNSAMQKAKELAKEYKDDTSFAGITVKDINGDNSITFYSPTKLLAAQNI